MESSTTFSQVVFNDIPHTYLPSTPVTCYYTLTAPFQPNTRDWVGIFKVGWSTTKDYRTFVWVEPTLDVVGQEPVRKQVLFQDYYLPKDDSEFYQFCYVECNGQVRGASTPFCFKNPWEQSVDCSLEDDLMVITTQKQVEQSAREKDVLLKELCQIREQNATMKSALMEREQEIDLLKKQSEQREKEKGDLMKELSQMMEQNESLRNTLKEQQLEKDHLKLSNEELIQKVSQLELQQQQNAREQEILSQRLKSMDESPRGQECQQSLTHIQEKFDRAVMKINQLRQEKEELQGKVEVQSVEIAELRPSVRGREQELCNLQDTIQLLQVDLQSSEKEKERISAELHRMHSFTHDLDKTKRENQELRRSLSQQETLQNVPDDYMKEQYEIVLGQLQDAQTQLANEKQVSNDRRGHAEQAERALQEAVEQLQNVATSCDTTQRKSGKLSLQLTEAYGIIEDKVGIIEEMENVIKMEKQEKEEVSREIQNLKRDIERLREEFSDQAAPPGSMQPSSPHGSPVDLSTTTTQEQQQDPTPESHEFESLYTTMGNVPNPEETLMCRHCQETFPGITQDELVLHEQCHKVCPFCTLICDALEQAVFEDHVYSHEV